MIKDSDRKILWTRSGNRCSMCDLILTMKIESGKNIIVGEEAHIISKKINGPRHEKLENYDTYENLILLCPNHHSIIDKNPDDYTVERIKSLKEKHEKKIAEKVSTPGQHVGYTIYSNAKIKAELILSGSELVNIVYSADEISVNNDEPETDEELDLIKSLLEQLEDSDVFIDSPSAIPGFQMNLTERINGLMKIGFIVLGTKEKTKIKFMDKEMPWSIAHIIIARFSRSNVVKLNISKKLKTIIDNIKAMSSDDIKKALEMIESGNEV